MAPSSVDKQTAGYNTTHNWLMNSAICLPALCDMYVEVKMAPIDVIWLFLVLMLPLPSTLWLPANPILPPYMNGID